jgi:hypothetical protein
MRPNISLARFLRLALGLHAYLASTVTRDEAIAALDRRLRQREENFVATVRRLVYREPRSPYRTLLRWAGCEAGDLEAAVRNHGVEGALERLRAAGVYVTFDEFKARHPLIRAGRTLEHDAADFDNPTFAPSALRGGTSGTTSGQRGRVSLDWHALAEEAANELLLYETHGIAHAPLALWLPGPPGLAGLRNVLLNAKFGRAPARWFSPTATVEARFSGSALAWVARAFGTRLPRPEAIEASRALDVAHWLATAQQPRVLSTFSSSAVRVAAAALEAGLDLGGAVIFASGEPLTSRRRAFVESSGAAVFARYVTAESGVVAGACSHSGGADDMHVYIDRLAVIEPPAPARGRVLFASLTPNTPKVLLNVDFGDRASLERRPCDCLFGQLGMDLRISGVSSVERVTAEGATVLAAELDEIVAAHVELGGGTPDDYQFRSHDDNGGSARLTLFVSPEVRVRDDDLVEAILSELGRRGPGERIAADVWRQARTLAVVRERPIPTSGFKLPRFVAGPARR